MNHDETTDTIAITRDGDEYRLSARTLLALPRDQVFPFFAAAENLGRITPPDVDFGIRTPGPILMRPGTLIDYVIRLHGIPMHWRTAITMWEPPYRFADTQLRGPYAVWIHTHTFTTHGGATLMEDVVRYKLPLGPLGRLAHPLVRRQLVGIFRYRATAVRRELGLTTSP